ncbi:PIN-like domain-containing protein [Bacillus thuringiensis]|uniref:PIN-like domain-containing protein n=1 Tax=Bacillus thuringiensis TaxID=1428 RepID=UPI000BFD7F4E|nr:PIN-like domain-containing protein [Bacillus thuringiensis]PGU99179.1 hypothetical protein COD69_13130 [Bacillus thuringiensis]
MLEQFKGFIGYTDEEFKELWKEAVFVIDTNILINFYKYTSKESTQSLLDILKKLKETNRLWIPHQVALEYFFNYEDNMFKQNEGYDLLGKELAKLKEDAKKILSTVKSKHPYIMTDRFQFFIKSIEQSNQDLQEQIKKEIENLPDSHVIQKDLLELLDGIVGEPYSQKEIDAIEKAGKERFQHDVPPGFKDKDDKNKQGYRTYGDFRYQQLYGDLIVWYQIMDRAKKKDSPTSIILITEDRKEDWWEKDKGQIKRPHPQLIQEYLNTTQQKFYMYRTESFVKNAIEYLGADVTEEQYKEVSTEIENIRKAEEKHESEEKHNSIERYYRNILNDSNIPVRKILEYLSESDKNEVRKRLNQAIHDKNSQGTSTEYNNAMIWAICTSVPNLEQRAKELTTEIAIRSYGEAKEYLNKLNSMPEDSINKGIALLGLIKDMENYLYNNGLPF